MINILFIHQSAELYGSDKTLLLLLKHIDKTKFCPVVVLPNDGPLKIELEKENIKVVIAPVLKLYRKMFTPKNILKFINDIKKGIKTLDVLNKQHHFDIVYSNTLAVLLGVIYAKKRKIKHLWHVHEIIESPKLFSKLFVLLLDLKCNTKIVYNSISTKFFWEKNKGIIKKSSVVLNGIETPLNFLSTEEINEFRKKIFNSNSNSNEIVIALIGRISRWKGQLILLKAFYHLTLIKKNIKLVFVGSPPPNQECFLEELKNKIKEYKLNDKVVIIPFQNEINKVWQSIDIAVVPSIEPEPFGLVAVEAMMANKPVIASNHGGLSEIILNNKTGFLVNPNDENQLSEAISNLIKNPSLRTEFGKNGYERAIKEFSIEKHVKEFEAVFQNFQDNF
jgi:glycosyltransferase involved in cell wall biosynthesis